jgi:hypothetical protein
MNLRNYPQLCGLLSTRFPIVCGMATTGTKITPNADQAVSELRVALEAASIVLPSLGTDMENPFSYPPCDCPRCAPERQAERDIAARALRHVESRPSNPGR